MTMSIQFLRIGKRMNALQMLYKTMLYVEGNALQNFRVREEHCTIHLNNCCNYYLEKENKNVKN